MQIVIISGLSGSGKSIALHMLEDRGFYCVDNLPPALFPALIETLTDGGYDKLAVAIDSRGGEGLLDLPEQLKILNQAGHRTQFIFLDAKTETLLKRYGETRRRHPLMDDSRTLSEAILEERERLAPLAELGVRLDTSDFRANTLRHCLQDLLHAAPPETLTLIFESFGFKHGIPLDPDLVFDLRCLPNPHYVPHLRELTGRDAGVISFLEAEPPFIRMREDIVRFIDTWLPAYRRDNRAYLTVGLGCTGGQHRSVYMAEWLAHYFSSRTQVLVRHRELPLIQGC